MSNELTGILQLGADVLIIPVDELAEESRAQIEFEPGDFAVSRLQSRNGSKIVGAEAADVLSRFREPRTVVEAVVLFGREKNVDPDEVLRDAYPFLKGMVEAGFLVRANGGAAEPEAQRASGGGTWQPGMALFGAQVVRTIQVFDDTEVLLLARPDGQHSVLKVERLTADGAPIGAARARLEHEANVLRRLDAGLAPAALGIGEVDGRRCVELAYIAGVDAAKAAEEWRQLDREDGRSRLLELVTSIARAYVTLHDRNVIHGDVHPRNVLVQADGSVRLIDFGMAIAAGDDPARVPGDRGGVPFFFEPELARAYLAGESAPAPSPEGEQYAVAAMIYSLITGAYWQDFRLGRQAMLEDIVSNTPLTFAARGVDAWPAMESVLQRALAKAPADRFASMAEFADAIGAVRPPSGAARANGGSTNPSLLVDEALAHAGLGGSWFEAALEPAPRTSINYGSAGIALGLLHIARQRRDATILALSDLWSLRASREMDGDDAFYNDDIQITRQQVGEASPYHSPSGVHAVSALVALARGDMLSATEAVTRFLQAARRPLAGLDLTLGECSVLLGCAILLDALQSAPTIDAAPIRELGDATLRRVWSALDSKPAIANANVEYLGIAHGWAGFLYATLQWCRVSGAAIPPKVEQRLDELARFALPHGRGLEWPWMLRQAGEPMTMPGWCNGTSGYVFLWTLAERSLRDSRYRKLADRAAWRAFDADEPSETLCCGLAGRGYAMLNMFRLTQDGAWVERARDLVRRGMRGGGNHGEYAHSLWKGRFGLAVLAAELEHPDESATPFFEPEGYQA